MAYLTTDYQIASGHNNAGSLTAITSLSVSSIAFTEPHGLPFSNRGNRITLSNGAPSRVGRPRMYWVSDMLVAQYWYLVNNYEGLVTIRTPYGGTTWANYNAILTLPDPDEMQSVVFAGSSHDPDFKGAGFTGVRWTYTQMVAL